MMNIIESITHIENTALGFGLSVKELYSEAGVDISTRTRWRNSTSKPNYSTLEKLEKVLEKKAEQSKNKQPKSARKPRRKP